MKEFIVELLRIAIAPIFIGVSTLFVGSKIKERETKKERESQENRQINGFYLKLLKLKKVINKYKSSLDAVRSLKEECEAIESGEADSPEGIQGMPKEEFLEQLRLSIRDKERFSLPEALDPVNKIYDELKQVPIDKMTSKKNFMCQQLVEMDYTARELVDMIEDIEELIKDIEPKYK